MGDKYFFIKEEKKRGNFPYFSFFRLKLQFFVRKILKIEYFFYYSM